MPQSIRRLARSFVLHAVMPAALGASLLSAVAAAADEWCTLSLKDGRSLSGILVDANDAQVTIRPDGGANTTFDRAEIVGMKLDKSPRETYLEKRAALKGDDLAGRYDLLLQFYYKNEKNQTLAQFSKEEAAQLAADFPDSAQVKKLSRVIADRLARTDDAGAAETKPETPPETRNGDKNGASKGEKGDARKDEEQLPSAPAVGLLSAADQNLLRVYQLDFTVAKGRIAGMDKGASIVVPKEVVETLFKEHPEADELAPYKGPVGMSKFRQLTPLAQLDVLFQIKDRALYSKVEVKTEPAVLAAFRTHVHPHVAAHFSKYFAGQVSGLIAKPKTSQAEAYTDFLALNKAVVDGHRILDRDTPENSLLLQWGLPRESAKYPAPNIKGWKPCFSGPRDPRFIEIARWIKTTFDCDAIALPPVAAPPAPTPTPPASRPSPVRSSPPTSRGGPAGAGIPGMPSIPGNNRANP